MTHFDNLLKAAFEAGYACAAGDAGHYVAGGAPSFDEWRASLSGLDDVAPKKPIKLGDVVRIVGGSRYFDPIRDAHHRVLRPWHATQAGERAWIISTPIGEYYVPESIIEKVQA